MSDDQQARVTIDSYLATAGEDELLRRVELTAALQREADLQQRTVVARAVERHSWSEIGAALGVSKQAAHRKFVTALAEDLKQQYRESKRARRAGTPSEAGAALGAVLAKAETLRKVPRP